MTMDGKGPLLLLVGCMALLIGCSTSSHKVLLIARETSDNMNMMIDSEVKPIEAKLSASGFKVVVASETRALLGSGGSTLQPDLRLSEVRLSDYVGVIIPCMAAGGTPNALPTVAVELVKKANSIGMPIAAQQSGVELLGKAGILKGRNFAIEAGQDSQFPEGTYKGVGVVVDGTLVTSGTCPYIRSRTGMPDGTSEMTTKFIGLLTKSS